jgi:GT2 family glycosyltransferase
MSVPRASVIVPLSGGPAQALRCFQGIAEQANAPAHEIIVVDNASVGLQPLLTRLEGDVEVVRTERRLGFAGAAAAGLEVARGELVVLLRDGAVPGPAWLAALCAALEDPSVGLAASITAGDPAPSPVTAWSLALPASHLREIPMPRVADPFVAAALALSITERRRRTVSVPASVVSAPGARTGGLRRPVGETPELTVVIPTLDAASERVRSCIAAVQATTDVAHEIAIIDNGSPPQGFASPVNAGLRAARTPYVVVMNDDVEPLAGWWSPLRATLDTGIPVAFPLTIDGPMRFDFPAWCFAMTSETVERFSHAPGEFFDPSLVVWFQDTDLLHRLRQADQAPALADGSRIRHGLSATVMSEDPELSAWIRVQVTADRERFLRKHPDVVLDGHALVAS